MKKVFIMICVATFLLSIAAAATNLNELASIKALLENGTIDNYESILIPLRGDPENFNIKSTDDLSTIEFGDGVEGYSVDFEKLEEAYENGEKEVFPYLNKNNKYYFPVIVSGREIAVAEIIKNEEGYRVFCVTAGPVSDNFMKEKKEINLNNAKYVTDTTIINGFVLLDGGGERFIDLDKAETGNAVSAYSIRTEEENIAEEFIQRRGESDEILRFGGGTTVADKPIREVISIAVIFAVALGVLIYILIKRKKAA